MLRRGIPLLLCTAAFMAVLAGACAGPGTGGAPSQPLATTKVNLGITGLAGFFLPMLAAMDHGFFKDQGIEAEWVALSTDRRNRNEAVEILMKRVKTERKIAEQIYDYYTDKLPGTITVSTINEQAVQAAIEGLADVGELLQPLPKANKYINPTYLEKAKK